jgi:hypothetical protein
VGEFVSTQTYNTDTISVFSATTSNQVCRIDRREVQEARWVTVGAWLPVTEKTATALELWQ